MHEMRNNVNGKALDHLSSMKTMQGTYGGGQLQLCSVCTKFGAIFLVFKLGYSKNGEFI